MTKGIVVLQLVAVRNLCLALAKSADILLAAMEDDEAAAVEDMVEPGACVHPLSRRIPIPAMGPKRFKCMDCNQDVVESTMQPFLVSRGGQT